MSIWKGLVFPFSLIWKSSNVLAPARDMVEQAEDWTDYACAVFWIVLVFSVLSFFAFQFSTQFILQLGAVLAALVVGKIAWHYFS